MPRKDNKETPSSAPARRVNIWQRFALQNASGLRRVLLEQKKTASPGEPSDILSSARLAERVLGLGAFCYACRAIHGATGNA
jgi:hypothetical protein